MSSRVGTLAVVLLLQACSAWHSGWPRWVVRLEKQVQCGMTLAEVQDLTSRKVEVERLMPRFGTHRISDQTTDLGLRFTDRGLESVSLSKVYGVLQIRQSPRRNLCTGGLTFFLELQWVETFQGSAVYLDGELVAEDARSGLIVEVPLGSHTLRVETLTAGVAVKQVIFESDDSGNRLCVLTHEDLPDDSGPEPHAPPAPPVGTDAGVPLRSGRR